MSARNFNVRLLSVAERDLLDIIDYFAAESPSAALKVLDTIEKRLQELRRHPLLGRAPADTNLAKMGYRVLVAGGLSCFPTSLTHLHVFVRFAVLRQES